MEGIRKDVVIANTSLLNTDWYTRQLIRRPIFEYDAAKGPAIYRNRQWTKPTSSPLAMTLDQADAVPLQVEVRQMQYFAKEGTDIVAQVTPRVLARADIFVYQMIKDAFPQRPIYFSRTSGGYAHELGLGNYVVTQGLARKLLPSAPQESKDIVRIPGEGYLDLTRTRALWDSVFVGHRSIAEKGKWIDKPSVGIPYLYVTTGLVLSSALELTGEKEAARRSYELARGVAEATRLDDLFRQIPGPEQLLQPSAPTGDVPLTTPVESTPRP